MTGATPPGQFTSAEATATLREACREVDLRHDGAVLLRLGENAIFQLAHDPVVVRIGRNLDVLPDAAKEVRVATWLCDVGLPAVEPTACTPPLIARDRPVTFWKLIKDSGQKATIAELGTVLRQLHALPVPSTLVLPHLDMFGRVAERISAAGITDHDRAFLAGRLELLQAQYRQLAFDLPPAAVHGDAHQSNLIKQSGGAVVLIDLERFAFGPPESDLSLTATEHLIGWHTPAEYGEFVTAYGYDVMDLDGFPVLRAINELKMTTWLMQNIGESEQVAREFRIRLASLHDQDAPRHWQPH